MRANAGVEADSLDDIPAPILFTDTGREAHRDGGLDDHDSLGVHLHHQPDDRLHRRGIEEILRY